MLLPAPPERAVLAPPSSGGVEGRLKEAEAGRIGPIRDDDPVGLVLQRLAVLPGTAKAFMLSGRERVLLPPMEPLRLTGEIRPLAGRASAAAVVVVAALLRDIAPAARMPATVVDLPVRVGLPVGLLLVAVAPVTSQMAGPPVVERGALEIVAERAAMDADGRGRGFGAPLEYIYIYMRECTR